MGSAVEEDAASSAAEWSEEVIGRSVGPYWLTRRLGSWARCFFFFQAEDGIRDLTVTGVQTCALPISSDRSGARLRRARAAVGDEVPRPGRPAGARARPLHPASLLRLQRIQRQVLRER